MKTIKNNIGIIGFIVLIMSISGFVTYKEALFILGMGLGVTLIVIGFIKFMKKIT